MTNNDGFIETILVDIWNDTAAALKNTDHTLILAKIGIGLLLILGIIIIINQIRIRKQLRQVQEHLEAISGDQSTNGETSQKP